MGGGSTLASGIEDNNTLLFCDVGHNNIEIVDVKRIIDKLDANLAAYEKAERKRRKDAVEDEKRQKKIEDIQEVIHQFNYIYFFQFIFLVLCLIILFPNLQSETKQRELSEWLEERRNTRALDRRSLEQQRIKHMQEEMEEKKRLADMHKEEERKAAEEAAAKKAKKKDKKGKKQIFFRTCICNFLVIISCIQ